MLSMTPWFQQPPREDEGFGDRRGLVTDLLAPDSGGFGVMPYDVRVIDFPVHGRPIPCRRFNMSFIFGTGSMFEIQFPSWLDSGGGYEEPWYTIAALDAGHSLWHPQGAIMGMSCPSKQKTTGRQRFWSDNPRAREAETQHMAWKHERAREWFASRDAFWKYCGRRPDGTFPRFEEWFACMS